MSKRYSGKSFKDSSVMKKAKLSFKEKRKLKREKKEKKLLVWFVVCILFYFVLAFSQDMHLKCPSYFSNWLIK